MTTAYPARRTAWRYISLLVLVAALFGGWSWFWVAATDKAQATVEGWRAREAKAGRIYACGSESIGGYPFRFEMNCESASALFQSNQPPVEIKARNILVAAQVYQPTLLLSEFHGPLTVAALGQAPDLVVNWKLFQSSVRGTPAAPERVSLVLDKPVVESMTTGSARTLLRTSSNCRSRRGKSGQSAAAAMRRKTPLATLAGSNAPSVVSRIICMTVE
ncbi:MAG: DUF2125 domain-containing protein [Hyphomicrobiales bacterium]